MYYRVTDEAILAVCVSSFTCICYCYFIYIFYQRLYFALILQTIVSAVFMLWAKIIATLSGCLSGVTINVKTMQNVSNILRNILRRFNLYRPGFLFMGHRQTE